MFVHFLVPWNMFYLLYVIRLFYLCLYCGNPGNISHIDEVFDEPSQPQANATVAVADAHSWNMSECLAYDQADDSADHIHQLENDIGEKISLDMRKQFQSLMTKRHDVTQKLQLLCLQSGLESNTEKQARNASNM